MYPAYNLRLARVGRLRCPKDGGADAITVTQGSRATLTPVVSPRPSATMPKRLPGMQNIL